MTSFQPGQTVTGEHFSGLVTGTVIRARPSLTDHGVTVLELDVNGPATPFVVPASTAHLVTSPAEPEETMTQPAEQPAKKTTRKSKKADAPAENVVDFKQLAAETRAKMQAMAQKGQVQPANADLPFPVSEAEIDAAAAPVQELPGTPALSSAGVERGTVGLFAVPLWQTERSTCNVRHHYDSVAIQELAASLKAEGQIENATGRWSAGGQVEIVAGESRRRAQLLREEQGETGLTLLVNIRELTDAEALSISATENMRRRNMTPLEECEAMQRLNDAGKGVEEIQSMFGYKTAQPVADRILVAKNLHTKGRDALEAGQISLAHAMVIARAPGEDFQQTLINRAAHTSAKGLAEALTRGQFLAKHAKFDVDASRLEVRRDLFDAFEPYFEDKGKAMEAQVAWAEAKAEKLRQKGKHAFVNVETGSSSYDLFFGRAKYEREYDKTAPGRGLVLFIQESTGAMEEISDVRLKGAKVVEQPDGTTTAETVREMPVSAYDAAHVLRARALRHSLLGDTRRTLVLTVHALIVNHGAYNGRAALTRSEAWNGSVSTAEIETKLIRWQTVLRPVLGTTPSIGGLDGEIVYGQDANLKIYDYLATLEEAELLDLLNVLVAARIYEPVVNHPKDAPASTFLRLAAETDANAYLRGTFTLTDDWLKRYPRHELVALAEEAGLGRALVEDCGTLKEMRARILEHADTLHRDGFVPKLVQFPAPPAPAQQQPQEAPQAATGPEGDREALEARAAAIIATLNREQAEAVLADWDWDHTDWDTLDAIREDLPLHLGDLSDADLRENAALWALEHQVTPSTETAAD